MRKISFRVDILHDYIPIGTLDFSDAPTVSCDTTADIMLTLRGNFRRNDKISYFSDELRPVMIIDGAETPLGVYRVGTVSESFDKAGNITDSVEAYDRTVLLTWRTAEQRIYFPAGTQYITAITALLGDCGVEFLNFAATRETLKTAREWEIGTPYIDIVNTLLAEINYKNIYCDIYGVMQAQPYAASFDTAQTRIYGMNSGARLLSPEFSRETDIFAKPNVFIAIVENPEYGEPMMATAVNDDPTSPLSVYSRRLRIPQIEKINNIASADELQAYVNRRRDESKKINESLNISTAILPPVGIDDAIIVEHPRLADGIFRETAWSLPMAAGQNMTHRLERMIFV